MLYRGRTACRGKSDIAILYAYVTSLVCTVIKVNKILAILYRN